MADAFKVTKMDIFGPNKGKRSGSRKVALLLTDGKPTLNTTQTYSYAEALKQDLDTLLVAGVSTDIAAETLRALASPSSFFQLQNYYDLVRAIDMFFTRIC